jgi:hypothetical protein
LFYIILRKYPSIYNFENTSSVSTNQKAYKDFRVIWNLENFHWSFKVHCKGQYHESTRITAAV